MSAAPRAGLGLALGGALALLLASFARWGFSDRDVFSRDGVFGAIDAGPLVFSPLGLELARFAAVQLGAHLLLGLLVWTLARSAHAAWPRAAATVKLWTVFWLVAAVSWVLAANAWAYPRSHLAENWNEAVRAQVAGVAVFEVITAVLAGLALLTIALALLARGAPRRTDRPPTGRRVLALVLGAASLAAVLSAIAVLRAPAAARADALPAAARSGRPNIILIGIDSLRCDVTQSGGGRAGLTPHVDRFLSGAVRFADAMTPLARTYPAWVSVLTGRHPHTTGAVVNLLPRGTLNLGDTLPQAFRRAGYRTAYAIDEVRFSNIDASYGFDQAISPPIGAADFLIGTLGDVPLTNLIANTRIGAWLLPQLHANRAVVALYRPDVFVARLQRELNPRQPLFLALHLTLPHWPYVWSEDVPGAEPPPQTWVADQYRPAVQRVDRQFQDVLDMLAGKGLLQNALVVLLSDHGEALGQADDSPWGGSGPTEDPFAPPVITGHGTSVLSPHQYRVVLALRAFGRAQRDFAQFGPREIAAPVSLEDLAPTFNELLALGMPAGNFDGLPLTAALAGTPAVPAAFAARIRFTETEFNPRGFLPGQQQTASALRGALQVYRVDAASGRLQIRPEARGQLMRERQYAALRGNQLVAALPNVRADAFRVVHIAAPGSLPRRLEARPATPELAEAAALWDALHGRFAALAAD